jgi:peptide/nickel transport system substrate-binding protein
MPGESRPAKLLAHGEHKRADLVHITRRELLRHTGTGLLGAALTTALGACSAAPATSGQPGPTVASTPGTSALASRQAVVTVSPTGAPGAAAAETPRAGGTLRVGVIGDFASLEGQTVSTVAQDTLWGVWDRLIAQDVTTQPQPMLAEGWDINPDYTQITIRLRKGVQFHSGREMTSTDVRWCLERLQDPKTASSLQGRALAMSGWETPDKYTVVVKANRPWPDAFDLFQYVNIIDPEAFQTSGLLRPSGTGPFVFAEYVQGDHLRLVKNKNYWQGTKPYLDELFVSITRDSQSAAVQVEAGTLDLVDLPLISDMLRLQNDPKYQVLANTLTGTFWCVLPNCKQAPTNNKLVRQALSYAIDRQRITATIWKGLATPEALPWSPSSPAYDAAKNKAYAFDLDRSKALLAQAGVSNLELDLAWSTAASDHRDVAQIYQADLAKIGITTTLKPLEPATYAAQRNANTYNLLIAGGLNGHLLPGALILGPYYGPQVNYSGFTDDEYVQLSNRVLAATEPALQTSLYAQLNDYYLDQAWVIPVSQNPPHLVARANVRGLRYDGREGIPLTDLWLS